SLYFKMKAINKYSSMLGLSFYIYYTTSFIYDEMGRIRIGLATAIAYYYFFKIEEKQNKIYILIVIFLGITIHSSIFFMLILPFFYKLKLNRKVLASILLISILIGFLFTPKTIAYIMIYIKKMSIPGVSNSNLTNLYEAIPRKISMRDLFLLIVGSKIIYDYTDIKNKEKYFKVIALNYYLGILIFFLFRNILILSTRGSEVMLASEFLLIPYLIKNLKKIEKLLAIILIVLYYGYLYFKIVLNQPYYPYNFI
ncbi:MAG: EpsG family protein, partial [Cetobacterium sp.]